MDNFKAVYTILSQLEKDMDEPEADLDKISPEALCVSENRWCRYIEMMADAGYIKGARMVQSISQKDFRYDCREMRITLKGLEYLQENSIMKKVYRAAKGIADIVPGI